MDYSRTTGEDWNIGHVLQVSLEQLPNDVTRNFAIHRHVIYDTCHGQGGFQFSIFVSIGGGPAKGFYSGRSIVTTSWTETTGTGYGVYILDTDGATIEENTITAVTRGIVITSSSTPTTGHLITNNTVTTTDPTYYGIQLSRTIDTTSEHVITVQEKLQ